MSKKIKIDDKEVAIDDLSQGARQYLSSLEFSNLRVQELQNMQAILRRAKQSYIDSLKQEMLSKKSGFLFEND
tara:strand:+ start:328 stop:546 length:219 start_codon:yes stop_codon:yes gene_type:complete